MTATHIRNRCYSQRLKDAPYGITTGKKPDVRKVQIFCSTCYLIVQNPKKLDPRSSKGVFIGYDRESSSYLVYNPDTRAVNKHRLVRFTTTTVNQLPETDGILPVIEEVIAKPELSDEKPITTKPEPRKTYPLRSRHQSSNTDEPSSYCLIYSKSSTDLEIYAFCDADWAASKDRCSISGFCISFDPSGPLISWKSKRQSSIAFYLRGRICCHFNCVPRDNLFKGKFAG